MSKDITVIIGIDTETDVGSFTPFYEGVKRGVPRLLDILEKKDVLSTFFFTGEAAAQNPEAVKWVMDAGQEVGCHSLYHETVGDELFPLPGVKPLLKHEVRPRIEMATDWVAQEMGQAPKSWRCPRLWGSTEVVNALESLGYVCDATYPMYFYREQFEPYYPCKDDWTKKGDMNILQIPNFADMSMKSADSPLERDRDQWPLFRTQGAKALFEKCEGFIEFAQEKGVSPVLCLYIHPWEFVEQPSEFHFGEAKVTPDEFIIKNCGEKACEEFSLLIDMLKDRGAAFERCDDFATQWKKNHVNL